MRDPKVELHDAGLLQRVRISDANSRAVGQSQGEALR